MLNSMGHFALIDRYFPDLNPSQRESFNALFALYHLWNERINLISRKDMEHLEEKHILHSLAIAKVIRFNPGARIMDLGTGGGFPGIPLAILFPEAHFILVDSIAKKINVVQDIVTQLGLKNVEVIRARAEELNLKLDYVVSRATAPMSNLIQWTKSQLMPGQAGSLPNGWLALKGGDLKEELQSYLKIVEIHPIMNFYEEEFFDQKVIVYLARQIL